jgi:DNA-binding transcriptional regulator GbsR (MarR family)
MCLTFAAVMEQYRAKIEEYGNYYEKQGFTPVASRVMIYLFLHPDGEATFDELVQYFGVSKSAVSNALKVLSAMEIVTEKTKSGARKRYFKATLERFFTPGSVIKSYRENRLILEDINKLRRKKDQMSEELQLITAFIKVLEKEYPRIYEEVLRARERKTKY